MNEKESGVEKIKKEIKTVTPAPQNKSTLGSIETKIDEILKYQKHMRYMAIFRGIVSFIFFFVFIIAPIIGGVYLVKYFNEKIGVEKVQQQYIEFLKIAEDIKNSGKSLKNVSSKVKGFVK